MSGFAGIIHFDGAPVDPALLDHMLRRLAYRGPDRQETWTSGSVSLVHALAKVAPEAESDHQPLTMDECTIVADARLDGRSELLQTLVAKLGRGTPISESAPDSELILWAYRAFGEACVEHLIGDFAFGIWDSAKRSLFAARDQLGKRQLFYTQIGSTIAFSNELRPLRFVPGAGDQLDDTHIADFLMFGGGHWLDKTTTAFANIHRLAPAHRLIAQDGALRITRYWEFPAHEPVLRAGHDDILEQFRGLLRTAVKDRMRPSRISLTASGGMDSSSLNAVAFDLIRKGEVSTTPRVFTAVSTEIPDREEHYTRFLIKRLGIEEFHEFVNTDGYRVLSPYQGTAAILVANPFAARTIDFHRRLASHAHQAIYGFNGEVLMTTERFAWFLQYMNPISFFLAWQRITKVYGKRPALQTNLFSRKKKPPLRDTIPTDYPGWFQEDFERELGLRERWRHRWTDGRPGFGKLREVMDWLLLGNWSSYDESENIDFTPCDIVDPYADVRLVRFFMSLPPLPWYYHKYLTRLAMLNDLPLEILNRAKLQIGDVLSHRMVLPESEWLDSWQPSERTQRYVDTRRIPKVAGQNFVSMEHSAVNMRPLMLNLWLELNLNPAQ